MTQRTLDSHASLTSLLIAFAALGCNDQRLRELGYTSDPITLSDEPEETVEPEACERVFIDADAVLAAAAADVAAAPAESRPFLRYLSLANLYHLGTCPEALAQSRLGVTRVLNSVSRAPSAAAPRVVGADDSVLAIDLRDYALTNPVVIESRSYATGWDALIGESPYAVELAGEAAAGIAAATGTRVPVLNADAFLLAAGDASIYYELLGIPATLGELRARVGLPSELDPAVAGGLRTAQQFSRVLRTPGGVRLLDRYSIASGTAGTYWEAFAIDTALFISDPLRTQPDVQRLVMFSQPNDFFAFAIFDAAGQRRASAELVLDSNRNDFTAHVLDSCANCHTHGIIPAVDMGRDIVLSHPDQFEPDVVAAYEASPDVAERGQQFEADSEPYQRARLRAGLEPEGIDPYVGRLYSINGVMTLQTAAADLLVTPEVLAARLGELPAPMRVLAFDLELSRERFGEVYREAYCVLHADDANPPAAAGCDSAP